MKNPLVLFAMPIVWTTLALAVLAGCQGQHDPIAADATASVEEELSKEPRDPEDLPPKCVPSCSGKTCGASNGCGGRCLQGYCPSGLTCGGAGTPGVCACKPSCDGKACGEPDGCGGTCNAGACPAGQGCSVITPGQCAAVPIGQGVECFVFGDGYSSMAGPSGAITFAADGQACIPDGTSTGTCRKWWGRCRTTDASHTPITFRGGNVYFWLTDVQWSQPSDAIFSKHYQNWFDPPNSLACLPNGTSAGDCYEYFGNGQTPDGRAVRCNLFNDGATYMTASTDRMHDNANSTIWGAGLNHVSRKWFGECTVGGCGDGICDPNEALGTCSDCTCGNGVCDGSETAENCRKDCVRCGDGVCNGGETATSCAEDCTRCGDNKCTGNETCDSCSNDCACPKTCSGESATSSAHAYLVYWENAVGCAGYSLPLANDYEEAKKCVGPYVTVHDLPPVEYWFNISDPKCHDIRVFGYGSDTAAQCARASSGYDFRTEGKCP